VPTTSRLAADPIASAVGHSSGALHGDVVAAAGGSRIRTLGPPALTMPSPGLAWRVTAVAKFLLIAIERKLRPANFAS
jgi:hypothetical protein